MNKLSIVPKGYRILVKPDPIEETSKGGIVLAVDKKLEKAGNIKGTLVAVGNLAWKGFKADPTPWAVVGDRILYSKYSGSFVKDPVTEEEYVLLNDEDVIATLETEE